MKKKLLIIFLEIILLLSAANCGQMAATAQPTSTLQATATSAAIEATVAPLDTARTVMVDGQARSYLLHIPSGLISDKVIPIVFVFPGLAEDPVSVQGYTDMNTVADANGFVVLYPAVTAGTWNNDANSNEIGFIRQMIDDIGTIIPVDSKRVFAAGFSNGALLTYRIACEMSDVFAAVAPVEGALITKPCQPKEAVSLIHVHGMLDTMVPYQGGPSPVIPDLVFTSVPESVATLAKLDGCNDTPDVKTEGHQTYTSYSGCKNGTAVELVTNDVLTHAWPSKYVVTNPTTSEMIWEFFASHPKP